MATAEEYEKMSAAEKKKEDWMNSKWRPMMGWMYMLVCMMDMVIFPILWSRLQTTTGTAITQWNPLTLQGAGLFHIAMGAVIGITAFGRTQEKLGGANNGGLSPTPTGFATPSTSSAGFGTTSGGFGTPAASPSPSSFGSSSGFGATAATPAVPTTPVATPLAAKKPMVSRPVDDGNMPPLD